MPSKSSPSKKVEPPTAAERTALIDREIVAGRHRVDVELPCDVCGDVTHFTDLADGIYYLDGEGGRFCPTCVAILGRRISTHPYRFIAPARQEASRPRGTEAPQGRGSATDGRFYIPPVQQFDMPELEPAAGAGNDA